MNQTRSFASGLLGATALTALHQTGRVVLPHPPRMDVLGMRAIVRILHAFGLEPPRGRWLPRLALAGDLVSNTLYYGLIGAGHPGRVWLRGAGLGLAAGLGALLLPKPFTLGSSPSMRTKSTGVATVALYLAGGLATAAALRMFRAKGR